MTAKLSIIAQFLGPLAFTLVAYGVYIVGKMVYNEITSPLRDLPGPQSSSFLYGNFMQHHSDVS